MNSKPILLIIGTVWPEPASSAAGTRMLQIIHAYQKFNWEIHFASTAALSDFQFPLASIHIQSYPIQLNNSSFDEWIKKLNPQAVLFDRFMIEEQFGWRVYENCPNAIRILDTEDLHLLRYGRQLAFQQKRELTDDDLLSPIAKREIASIYRCDLSLIISEYEMNLLQHFYHISPAILLYLPLYFPSYPSYHSRSFHHRKDFFFIGNFYHEPNKQTVILLKEKIWPIIRKRIPDATFHVYGAYVNTHFLNMNHEKSGFIVKGRAENAQDLFENYRCLLAPIPFGAGLKGKILEALLYECPFITSKIGAEGILDAHLFSNFIKDHPEEFAEAAIEVYTNENLWNQAKKLGKQCIENSFHQDKFEDILPLKTLDCMKHQHQIRKENFIGQILHTELNQSKKYLSKWIEAKNKPSNMNLE